MRAILPLAIIAGGISLMAGASDFTERLTVIPGSETVDFFNAKGYMTDREREAMEFLYSYMPLPDIADRPADFYLANVRSSFKARAEMPWGAKIPEREFKHFVLPVRVNNENLDSSRMAFYEELRDRVKNLSMTEAILEVNHWCHEKVTYQPSDARTSSPLATVKSAVGRCGEESTFTVAALRAVGIPARQVYTPRWAHTDDNHAWVEAWADGQWYFLGACEPEPVLDLGWFNEPAARGMLMTTKVFGSYDGPEDVLQTLPTATEINVTGKYAPVSRSYIRVTDRNGRPIPGASVDACIYNYAEYYRAIKNTAGSDGICSFTTGLGDLVIWASDGTNYGVAKVKAGGNDTINVPLTFERGGKYSLDFDINPPRASQSVLKLDDGMVDKNNRRKAEEDSIRTAYEATFANSGDADKLAEATALDRDTLFELLVKSRGNHACIAGFLSHRSVADKKQALELLKALREKDLRDVSLEVLLDHYMNTPPADSELYAAYLMNPRVENEMLTPYRNYLQTQFGENSLKSFRENPAKLVEWVSANIAIDTIWNPQSLRMSPSAVWQKRLTDKLSRNIFFVAAARSAGIVARIDQVTGKTQYHDSGTWVDVDFGAQKAPETSPSGRLLIDFSKSGRIDDPLYYTHFSISKIENGIPKLLEFGDWTPLSLVAPDGVLRLDCGDYILTTGQRMADGSVLAHSDIFNISENRDTRLKMTLRQDTTAVQVIGAFNSETLYHDLASATDKSLLSTTGRGYYVLGLINPNHEPSAHALNDLAASRSGLEKWNRKIILLFSDQDAADRFDAKKFPQLPENVVLGTDIDGKISREISDALKLSSNEMPVFIIADTFNRVVYVVQGYTINLGEKLLDVIHRL